MDRIDTQSGLFEAAVPPERGTTITAAFLNDVQEEICNAIESADLTLDPEDDTQLWQAICSIVPAGLIVMWSGSIATIPTGWALCDGNNYTPDLRDRMIVGAKEDAAGVAKTNVTGALTQSGGSADAVVVQHDHTATDAGHSHLYSVVSDTIVTDAGAGNPCYNAVDAVGTASGYASITVAFAGESGTNKNLPPYYALAYIMRLPYI